MLQPLEYNKREAISTVRELLDYNYNTSEELIVLEVRQRGIVVNPIWLVKTIEDEQGRDGDTRPIILAMYSPTQKIKCNDCYASDGTLTRADFVVLLDTSADWKAVCENCLGNYECNEDTIAITD